MKAYLRIVFSSVILATSPTLASIQDLNERVREDLQKISFPASSWILHSDGTKEDVLDVAIVGGGMAGITAASALLKEGISNIKIFDENPPYREGTWIKYDRKTSLRSSKNAVGPALGIPSLTFSSWYEAAYGEKAWKELPSIPTLLWNDYLIWLREVLQLPVENHMSLKNISPLKNRLELTFTKEGKEIKIVCRKVVLATGRDGSGSLALPPILKEIPKRFYAHSSEEISPSFFLNKRIGVVGAGASAFDAAAMALENGAKKVDMLVRRTSVPTVHKWNLFSNPGFSYGFFELPDTMRFAFFKDAFEQGIPPPTNAIKRVVGFSQFKIQYDTNIESIKARPQSILVKTNKGQLEVDFLVFSTGFEVDLSKRTELREIQDQILLWEDRVSAQELKKTDQLGKFPYLGAHFEFIEKIPGSSSYLNNIYCFNYGAFLSHGLLSGDIPGISIGATRLAQGIVADFFVEEKEVYFEKVQSHTTPHFDPHLLD